MQSEYYFQHNMIQFTMHSVHCISLFLVYFSVPYFILNGENKMFLGLNNNHSGFGFDLNYDPCPGFLD